MRFQKSIPFGDIGIAAELLHHNYMVTHAGINYILDFQHLPEDVKEKLNSGIYHVGESKQVDGNAWAVILNQQGVRIKDITAKKVIYTPDTINTVRSITTQMQFRQIYRKLQDVQMLEEYQIDRDRDRDIITPFLDARDFIMRAQLTFDTQKQREYLNNAIKSISTATHSLYTDLRTSVKYLARCTRFPVFQPPIKRKFLKFITDDMQLMTKFVGIQMNIMEFLGDYQDADYFYREYQDVLHAFLADPAAKFTCRSGIDLVQFYFPYDKSNQDCWLQIKKSMSSAIDNRIGQDEKEMYLVGLEDVYE